MSKYVYAFSEGNASMRSLLGGKGANLAEMTGLGLPVPSGFTITTEACNRYYADGKQVAPEIMEEALNALKALEERVGKQFGSVENPLLVSVRSGAAVSMPGMMDTILNLGLNDETVKGLAAATGNPRFAYDSYRRFIQMFSNVVMEMDSSLFEKALEAVKEKAGVKLDSQLSAENLEELLKDYKAIFKANKGIDFPQDPKEQLIGAINAVFRSWDNPRAHFYRLMNDIPSSLGTAVNVQSMVFGNMGDDCGTGVAFTRSPSTGENALFGEFLMNAQGEDVVAGIRTPKPIAQLKEDMPHCFDALWDIANKLEAHYKDMQDLEFTIEKGKLYMLQTRNGKRTAAAALRIAVEMVEEGSITKEDALLMVDPKQLDSVLHPTFEPNALKEANPIATGLPASPGAACGRAYFDPEKAAEAAARGEKVILVRVETSPEDIQGMNIAEGIMTARGGMTSHAAVVARGMGRCCVAGCNDIFIDEENAYFRTTEDRIIREGDYISLDGNMGRVYMGQLPTIPANVSGNFAIIMGWADEVRRLGIRTNADTPRDAKQALEFGAEGIGLCRTEHMFFDEDRIMAVRRMIVSTTERQRKAALEELLPMQRQDFYELYMAMEGRPVTIRLLDPPLHEFLPKEQEEVEFLAGQIGITVDHLNEVIRSLQEVNPMMGHRGCRLAVTFPEIARMQTTAIINAALDAMKDGGFTIEPQIMVPLVGDVKELEFVKGIIDETANRIMEERGESLTYEVGTMIELPRAALTADEIATQAKFFSFGTNDLSQMTFGFSRDDSGKFLPDYYTFKIFENDPFAKVDQKGVGKLIKMAVELGRSTNPHMHMGICGEHGGEPSSVEFCHNVGLDYVSCSPFRIPIAKLAAAQAKVKSDRAK
ncbi:MAG: pyruvate, phosphate dikinase [Clostridiales bacterium]|nr:pyruvate, phosphate dikinase [Clostridiales bacterium]